MSDIAKAMEKKGYTPLTANRFCAIGLRPSLSGFVRRPGMQKWFYNGTYMQDGRPIAIAAYSEAEAEEFSRRGFRPVEEGAASSPPTLPRKGRGDNEALMGLPSPIKGEEIRKGASPAQVKAKAGEKAVDGRIGYAGKKCG